MKKNYLLILLTIMGSQSMAEMTYHSMVEKDESKRVIAAMTQKAEGQDIRGLINALPELELIWKQEPLAYLEAVKVNVHALIASSDPDAVKAALNLFPEMVSKTCPFGTDEATNYFGLKRKIVSDYFNLKEVRANRERLLLTADFLAEVRARRIPGYRNQGTKLPGRKILEAAGVQEVADLPTEAQKEAVAKAVEENKENMKMNGLQGTLSSVDWHLTNMLTSSGQLLALPKAEKQEFFRELAKRAKFTEEEQKKLEAAP